VPLFHAIVLGIIQGLTEFLPVSSSAHLALTPWAFGWEEPGLSFDVALHVGTLAAVLWYFRKEWIELSTAAVEVISRRKFGSAAAIRLRLLVIGTVPGAIVGYVLQKQAETIFRTPALTGTTLIVMGIVLWLVDSRASSARGIETMNARDAVLVGLAQAAAIVPGVSRSGATITAGRALGYDRAGAATFSFLMSMPITAAAAGLKAPEALRAADLSPVIAGMIAAAISGWVAIAVLLRFVRRSSFGVFAIYRVLLGVGVLLLAWSRA
jgi:undecaprenyl-diphosphatase